MHLPMQCEPVQRTNVGQPNVASSVGHSNVSQPGIQPSGWFDDVMGVVRGVGQVAQTAGPILGSLGI